MMFSTTVQYAFRILSHLVNHPEHWQQVRHMAGDLQIPENYLSKVLQQLGRAGFVESQKGVGGGFRLRPEAMPRTLREVVMEFDGEKPNRGCAFGFPECPQDERCPLHNKWAGVNTAVDQMIAMTTVGEFKGHGKGLPSVADAAISAAAAL